MRPEPFGALLYHFGTRKLSFLKNRTIVEVVKSLGDHPDARSACRAAGIDDAQQAPYLHALGVLAQSKMLVTRGELMTSVDSAPAPASNRCHGWSSSSSTGSTRRSA